MKNKLIYTSLLFIFMSFLSNAWGMEKETKKTCSPKFANEWAKTIKNFPKSVKENIIATETVNEIKKRFLEEIFRIHSNQQDTGDQQKGIPIPKIINYIWVGGPIDKEYWETITRTAHIGFRERYRVKVWVDDPNNLRYVKKTIDSINCIRSINDEEYNFYVNKLKVIQVINIKYLRSRKPDFISNYHYKQYWRFIDSELVGLKNYAAASDLLRYLIKCVNGGVYMDTDLPPLLFPKGKETFLGDIILPLGFKCPIDNNPILLSSTMHPIMVDAVLDSLTNYIDAENFIEGENCHSRIDRKRLYNFIDKRFNVFSNKEARKTDRRIFTIEMSGPIVIQKAKLKYKNSLYFCNDTFNILKIHEDSLNTDLYSDQHFNLKEAFLELQKLQDNKDVNPYVVLESNETEEYFQGAEENLHKGRSNLKTFIEFYKHSFVPDKINKGYLSVLKMVFESINKSINKPIRPIHIGENFWVDYKCDNTWLKDQQPRSFTTDDIRKFQKFSL